MTKSTAKQASAIAIAAMSDMRFSLLVEGRLAVGGAAYAAPPTSWEAALCDSMDLRDRPIGCHRDDPKRQPLQKTIHIVSLQQRDPPRSATDPPAPAARFRD